jgi:predicted helicase
VIYTPNEIVRFMIESADWLCEKHFDKALVDENVEILDPAAGTGTFITELIEHFRGQSAKLRHKYLYELHANEVAILPYYVANLNIEATYAAINGYEEYPNLCFVDTLDNVAGLRTHAIGKRQHFGDLFGAVSEENVVRIKRQNKKKISVIIGNPPYRANQLNENENNKNREYSEIDRRIKETYIATSTAQKTKLYDMYARFFRWASDRIDENGIIAFVSNSSFIGSRTYDGFRKLVADEFNEIWVIDLKGNARTSGERRRREGGNVFNNQIRVGIAVYFCVKKKGTQGCHIRYQSIRDYAKSDEKREFLRTPISARKFEVVRPNKDHNWINLVDNDFGTFIPIASKETKAAKTPSQERAIFKLFCNGVKSNRDEWVYDFNTKVLEDKTRFFEGELGRFCKSMRTNFFDSIKWSRDLKKKVERLKRVHFDGHQVEAMWRPYVSQYYFADKLTSDILTEYHYAIFGTALDRQNIVIALPGPPVLHVQTLAVAGMVEYHCVGDANIFPGYTFDSRGARLDNITEWALEQFRAHYEGGANPSPLAGEGVPARGGTDEGGRGGKRGGRGITKDAIFHFVYGVLHDPIYREKYALNLRREFPRIPFYPGFWKWAGWGEELMALHIGYETVKPWPLERIDTPEEKSRKAGLAPKAMLRANKDSGNIQLDSETQLTGVPPEAWTYKLGNRSALEWILDQYKEKTPKDPIIREKFNTYRFADHKEKVIDLLKRVTRVSVETTKIVVAMRAEKR